MKLKTKTLKTKTVLLNLCLNSLSKGLRVLILSLGLGLTLSNCAPYNPGEKEKKNPEQKEELMGERKGKEKAHLPEPDQKLLAQEKARELAKEKEKRNRRGLSWKKITGEEIGISLPNRYQGGNPQKDLNLIERELEKINPQYVKELEELKKNPEGLVLVAFDPTEKQGGFLPNVKIAREKVSKDVTLETYLKAVQEKLKTLYELDEPEEVEIGEVKGVKMIGSLETQLEDKEVKIKQLFYTLEKQGEFWLVTYTTTEEDFKKRLPEFEKSLETLTWEKQEKEQKQEKEEKEQKQEKE